MPSFAEIRRAEKLRQGREYAKSPGARARWKKKDGEKTAALKASQAQAEEEMLRLGMTAPQYDAWKWETRFVKHIVPDYYNGLRGIWHSSPFKDL